MAEHNFVAKVTFKIGKTLNPICRQNGQLLLKFDLVGHDRIHFTDQIIFWPVTLRLLRINRESSNHVTEYYIFATFQPKIMSQNNERGIMKEEPDEVIL